MKYPPEIAKAARIAAPVFKKHEWFYGDEKRLPDELDLWEVLADMYDGMAADEDTVASRAGRFAVRRVKDEQGRTEFFELALVLAEIDVAPY